MSKLVVEVENLVKHYIMGEVVVEALRGVDFSIAEGEYTALMGPSGSGKSTLMHLIGCLDRPSSGVLKIGGTDVTELSANKLARLRGQEVGFVFQQFNLLPKFNILDNVMTPLMYQRIPLGERRDRAVAALERVGLADRMKHKPNELSGGQKQRVAIARAIVTEPSLILADEPTGALDSKTGIQIMELFEDLHSEGATVLLVTHDEKLGARCNRVVRLLDGLVDSDSAGLLRSQVGGDADVQGGMRC